MLESKPLYSRWFIGGNTENPTKCILALPGRGQSPVGRQGIGAWYDNNIPNTLVISVGPEKFRWYPMPNGPSDQKASVRGLVKAVLSVQYVLEDIEKYFGIESKNVILAGWSAGAAVALETITKTNLEFLAVISHAGSILEPMRIPKCFGKKKETPILMTHCKDDDVFKWEERFVPTGFALKKMGWNVKFKIDDTGGHSVPEHHVRTATNFICGLQPK